MRRIENIIMLEFGLDEVTREDFVIWTKGISDTPFMLTWPLKIGDVVLDAGVYQFIGWAGWVNSEDGGMPFEAAVFLVREDDRVDETPAPFRPTTSLAETLLSCPGDMQRLVA